jgi:hypothetical protein
MKATFHDYSSEWKAEFYKRIREGLNLAGEALLWNIKVAISNPSPPVSAPGAPPNRETKGKHPGLAFASMAKVDVGNTRDIKVQVGVKHAAGYMAAHELGMVPNVARRPWLVVTARASKEDCQAAFDRAGEGG